MDVEQLESLGLNRNEAIVYHALLQAGSVPASKLVKTLGIHRNIIYDNMEKLIEKGLASYIIADTKRVFTATTPDNLIDFLKQKRERVEKEIQIANQIIPEIEKLKSGSFDQEAQIFRGVGGIKKVLAMVLNAKENWVLGMTNASTQVLGETYWKNYNQKIKDNGITERFLINNDFKDIYSFSKNRKIQMRVLPKELDQITEIILFDGQVATFIYSQQPIVFLVKDRYFFDAQRKHFEFLWKKSK